MFNIYNIFLLIRDIFYIFFKCKKMIRQNYNFHVYFYKDAIVKSGYTITVMIKRLHKAVMGKVGLLDE
ncbi:hypothetical protein DW761_08805 [Absiella sp. AM29-15]|nr:hypothetical protein DW761_08805 [Absiella sp. AM29-15]